MDRHRDLRYRQAVICSCCGVRVVDSLSLKQSLIFPVAFIFFVFQWLMKKIFRSHLLFSLLLVDVLFGVFKLVNLLGLGFEGTLVHV